MSSSKDEGAVEKAETKVTQGQLAKEGETRHSNPFLADGLLSKKADYIITHSTITRTELHIADPDLVQGETKAKCGAEVGNERPQTTPSVEVEVKQTTVTTPDRQKAEEVQLKKDKKCKCCTVQ